MDDLFQQIKDRFKAKENELESLQRNYQACQDEFNRVESELKDTVKELAEYKKKWTDLVNKISKEMNEDAVSAKPE